MITTKQADRLERLLRLQVELLHMIQTDIQFLVLRGTADLKSLKDSTRAQLRQIGLARMGRVDKLVKGTISRVAKEAFEEELANAKDERAATRAVKKFEREQRQAAEREAEAAERDGELLELFKRFTPPKA